VVVVPTPHPGPAVHRYGSTALHWAAYDGNRRIVRLLVAFNADVNAQEDNGCAVSACGESA
jgi:ankyrin repeat protein